MFIPYGKQLIEEDDIAEVVAALKSDWLTTGPAVTRFEHDISQFIDCPHAVAVSSGTAALHAAMYAIDLQAKDEVIVPPITFAATANCVAYMGATPVFADVEAGTLLIDPETIRSKISSKTKAVIAVDYAGQTCNYTRLKQICKEHNLVLIGDCCHSLGGKDENKRMAGTLADLSVFSFHPVKHITTGEGGMLVTSNNVFAERARKFRNHGINADANLRAEQGTWAYAIDDLGYNYRITDLQCALGVSQLKKLPSFIQKRQLLAAEYTQLLKNDADISPLEAQHPQHHAYHLYVVKVPAVKRKVAFTYLKDHGVGANVHYIPVHYHPYYQKQFGYNKGLCPVAETAYEQLLTLPLHPAMQPKDIEYIVTTLRKSLGAAA